MSTEKPEPTPAELVAQLSAARRKNPQEFEKTMERIVSEAEVLGEEHMRAIVEWVDQIHKIEQAHQPRFRVGSPDDLLQIPGGGYRYRADDMNATLELRLVIDGRKYLCREMIDSMLWEHKLSRDETAFDSYLKYALHKWLGNLVADSQAMEYFMSRVWVVRPGDEHDLQRCAHSNDLHPNMWPRCLDGVILTELPGVSPVPGVGGTVRRDAMLGYCPCRCHRYTPDRLRSRPYLTGMGVFDEDSLDNRV